MTDTYIPKTDLSGKAKEVVRDVKAKAAGMTDDITKAAKDNAAQLGNAAKEFATTAADKVGDAVTQRKSLGADYIGSIAQATHQAAMAFDNDLPQAAHYIRQASEQIQGVADSSRERCQRARWRRSAVRSAAADAFLRRCGGLGLRGPALSKSTPPKQATSFDARREQ